MTEPTDDEAKLLSVADYLQQMAVLEAQSRMAANMLLRHKLRKPQSLTRPPKVTAQHYFDNGHWVLTLRCWVEHAATQRLIRPETSRVMQARHLSVKELTEVVEVEVLAMAADLADQVHVKSCAMEIRDANYGLAGFRKVVNDWIEAREYLRDEVESKTFFCSELRYKSPSNHMALARGVPMVSLMSKRTGLVFYIDYLRTERGPVSLVFDELVPSADVMRALNSEEDRIRRQLHMVPAHTIESG